MAYGTLLSDVVQSSTANTPPQFNDGNGTQVGTLCRAWVNFNGSTSPGTIRASFNVGSVTKNGTGDYTVNFTTALPDANYSTNVTNGNDNTGNAGFRGSNVLATQYAPTTSAVRVSSWNASSGTNRISDDTTYLFVAVFR